MDPAVREAVEAQSAQPLQVPDPDDLAYILYTSGKPYVFWRGIQ